MLKIMGSLTNNGTNIEGSGGSEAEISSSAPDTAPNSGERDERTSRYGTSIALPAHIAGSGTLDRLVDTARDYAEASTAENTNKAYAADWKHFTRWCRLKGTDPLPPLARDGRALFGRFGRTSREGTRTFCLHDRASSLRACLELQAARVHS